mgnify:CR=1 FL=1
MSGVPWVKREIQSPVVGEGTPLHDTVMVPPAETVAGEAERVGVGAVVERTTLLETAKRIDCKVSVKSAK